MAKGKKLLYLLRHGETEMNKYMDVYPWGTVGFRDPSFFDTRLTEKGQQQAVALNQKLHQHHQHRHQPHNDIHAEVCVSLWNAELLVSSPLSRAIHTAELAFQGVFFPPIKQQQQQQQQHDHWKTKKRIVLPLASERMYLSSDVGRSKQVLMKEFHKEWDFNQLHPEDNWWFQHPHYNPAFDNLSQPQHQQQHHQHHHASLLEFRPRGHYSVGGEPKELFSQRIKRLYDWLEQREEESIVLACHWAVARAITGKNFENCEINRVVFPDEVMQEPFLDH